MKIGVLALQGDFIEHVHVMKQIGVEAVSVRLPGELSGLHGVIIPGGESTTILHLIHSFNFAQPLKEMAEAGLPIFGTCAGMICLARRATELNSSMETLALMDVEVRRNAFGRQVDSFETELTVPALGEKPFPGVFIRAPIIEKVGAGVEILAKLSDGRVVAVRQGKLVATAFHPELSKDMRLHQYFLKIAGCD